MPKAPYGTWSSGRPRGRADHVTATPAARQQAAQTVTRLVLAAGFVAAGMTEPRVVTTYHGEPVHLPGRQRFENRNDVRVTIGRDTTFFYTVGEDGTANNIAVHKTRDVKAVQQTLTRLA